MVTCRPWSGSRAWSGFSETAVLKAATLTSLVFGGFPPRPRAKYLATSTAASRMASPWSRRSAFASTRIAVADLLAMVLYGSLVELLCCCATARADELEQARALSVEPERSRPRRRGSSRREVAKTPCAATPRRRPKLHGDLAM